MDEPLSDDDLCHHCRKASSSSSDRWIFCDECQSWFHCTCVKISDEEAIRLDSSNEPWTCASCQAASSILRISCQFCFQSFDSEKGLKIHVGRKHKKATTNHQEITSGFSGLILELKKNVKILRRIPKGARSLAAKKFAATIENCVKKNDIASWENLLLFPYKCLRVPGKSKQKCTLTTSIKAILDQPELPTNPKANCSKSVSLRSRVSAKVSDFDIKGAVKLLSSNDTLAEQNQATYDALCLKHPQPSRTLIFPDPPTENSYCLRVTEAEVFRAINSFSSGSSSGIDGLLPQHLKDLTSFSAGAGGKELLKSLVDLCNLMLRGEVVQSICPILYGASLCALIKKDGGIRPIAVGNTLRRLTAKLACTSVRDEVGDYFRPKQVGFATKAGCEVAIHSLRTYISLPENSQKVMLKIDYKNAFNSVERDTMLTEISKKTPSLYPFLWQCYSTESNLFFGSNIIPSRVGAQQGDPTGPLAFSLAIHPIVDSLSSDFVVFYLDDGTLVDSPNTVLNDFASLIERSKMMGLEVNPAKCELFFCSGEVDPTILSRFQAVAPGIRVTEKSNLELLGSPIFDEAFLDVMPRKFAACKTLIDRLDQLDAQVAYFLLKHCFAIPKLTYLLRTSPTWKFPSWCENLDLMFKFALESILNTHLEDSQWLQSSLPVQKGGMGIRRVTDIALPAFLSSCFSTHSLAKNLLKLQDETVTLCYEKDALDMWHNLNADTLPEVPHFQKNWDAINLKRVVETELNYSTTKDLARFKSIQCKESGAWLQVVPSRFVGTNLDDNSFRICASLRLGSHICKPHTCVCGSEVSSDGTHGLSCSKALGRFPRHSELNEIIRRALNSIHMPSILEPTGMSRDDGKRPDGMTLIPWKLGKHLVWDATCVDTLAESYVNLCAEEIGAAADLAAKKKHNKYKHVINGDHLFVPFAVETMGPWCVEASILIDEIGSLLRLISGEPRSKQFLIQRISLCIQRGNAASVIGTIPSSLSMEEIFYLP